MALNQHGFRPIESQWRSQSQEGNGSLKAMVLERRISKRLSIPSDSCIQFFAMTN